MAKRKDSVGGGPVSSATSQKSKKPRSASPSPVSSRQTRSQGGPIMEAVDSRRKFEPKQIMFEPIGAAELADIAEKGAWESIVSKYETKFEKDPPRIPLCRLMPMEAVRNLQEESVMKLKKGFRESGYVVKLSEFHITEFNETGETRTVADFKPEWDPLWTQINEQFEQECDSAEEFKTLKDKMFWVFDGNHRYTAWSAVASENPDQLQYHPCVRFSLLNAGKDGFKKVEQAMHALNS